MQDHHQIRAYEPHSVSALRGLLWAILLSLPFWSVLAVVWRILGG